MIIEQKAKRYDEALKWMRRLYPTMAGIDKEDAEHFFPELRESEDERIRKECISIINAWDKTCRLQGDYCEVASSCIAWLEKQGQVKESFISQHEIETCKENDDSLTSEDERMIRIIENAICTNEAQELVKTKYGLELTDLADWLEKQGKKSLLMKK